MPPFVVLKHDTSEGTHFDFMLQVGEVLRTWALPYPPAVGGESVGRKLPDHRLEYLDYEGPISGHRGSVSRFDAGDYRLLEQSEAEMAVYISGKQLTGRVLLRRLASGSDEWHFSLSSEDDAEDCRTGSHQL
jgi:hypothetical protein